ncbi:MAG: aldo/keto reductase [Patescibacteria group bacterium]
MQYKKINGVTDVPVLGIGTWGMGGEAETVTDNDQADIQAIRKAIELGMTHIDTAEIYGKGHAEELVGEAIKGFDRSKLFITTKVARRNCAYDNVLAAMDRSLKRLGTNYVDLYLIHSPNPEIPFSETMKAMDRLVEEGKTRLIGVSNFPVEQMIEAQKHSKNKITANQVEYNLMTRNDGQGSANVESEIIPYCQANSIMIIAYRPLAKGILSSSENNLLGELAKKYGKTPAQIALNWVISKKSMVTIPKASSVQHLEEDLGAIGWDMDSKDIKKLDEFRLPQ